MDFLSNLGLNTPASSLGIARNENRSTAEIAVQVEHEITRRQILET